MSLHWYLYPYGGGYAIRYLMLNYSCIFSSSVAAILVLNRVVLKFRDKIIPPFKFLLFAFKIKLYETDYLDGV